MPQNKDNVTTEKKSCFSQQHCPWEEAYCDSLEHIDPYSEKTRLKQVLEQICLDEAGMALALRSTFIRETLSESGRWIDALKKRGRVLKKRGRVLKKRGRFLRRGV